MIFAKGVFICLQQHAQLFPKLIIRVPHNGLFDTYKKTLETIEHAQIEFFILIIRVSHVSSINVWIKAI